jgi:hypothetical protein
MTPWGILSERVAATFGEGPAPNISAGPTAVVAADAVVIRPDEPWLDALGASYTTRLERYVCLLAVGVGDPASSLERLYSMALAITEAASDAGWAWATTSGVTLDETTGVPLLVVAVHVTYKAPK